MTRSLLGFAILVSACGPGIDRTATLERLRAAIEEEIDSAQTLGEHNEIVVTVSRGDVLNGMRQSEVEAAIGRGQECGTRPICSGHGFESGDWLYEVGRQDGLPAGPSLVVGFDRQGFVTGTYYLTRSAPAQAQ
ncbi:MAG: hypothetical protein IT378_23565 [Sandaracinaceae bacterium]|nr:hypothetical protein [Sandaracinaceae bacterium]